MEITLQNFQAHQKTILGLREGLVCVVGPSNAGKSSIVRAIRWLIYDSLRGNRFVRMGQDMATATLDFGDTVVTRAKSKKQNRYGIGRDKPVWYDAIGTGAPPEVTKALQIPTMRVDKDTEIELNVAMQLDQPFLIFASESLRAKFLNVLTGGHVLDAAVRETNRKVKEIDDKYKTIDAQWSQTIADLKQYADLESRGKILSDVGRNLDDLTKIQERMRDLEGIQFKLDELVQAKARLQRQQMAVAHITDESINMLEQWLVWLKFLEDAQRRTTHLRAERLRLDTRYQTVASVQDEDLAMAAVLISRLDDLQQSKETLTKLNGNRLLLTVAAAECEGKIITMTVEYEKMADSVCQACGQQVTRDVRKKQLEAVL